MSGPNAIMAYVPGTEVTGMSTVLPDWQNNRMYSFHDGDVATSGVSQFTGFISGDLTLEAPFAELSFVTYVLSTNAACLTQSGYLVFTSSTGNSATIGLMRAATLKMLSSFGISSSSLAPSTASRIISPGALIAQRVGKTDYVVSLSIIGNEVCVLSIPGLANINCGNTTESTIIGGPGPYTNTVGTAYVFGLPAVTTAGLGFYTVSVPACTLSRIATILPSAIDPTWTHISSAAGCALDQTDGNPLLFVSTLDSVTNQSYLIKVNGVTGAVIWACAVPAFAASLSPYMPNARILNSTFYMLATGNLYKFNTANGTVTHTVVGTDIDLTGPQFSEDVNNSITVFGSFVNDALNPNYIGTYMGTEGNHTYTGWLRYFPAAPTPPLPPAPPPVTEGGPPVVSINRAWSYVLDGHTFYVLDLGAQGTFQYDIITNQWSSVATGTLPTDGSPEPQWNFQNGGMWGSRVVGFDLALPTVWETTPASTLDNDATQISHVSTGAISTRSRIFVSCDSLRISASFGLLDSTAAVNFNMRFSDDQGQTWSDYFTVVLSPEDYDDEIAWRSLGSFMAPGRVFELADVGGLIRIDGCDAFLNGFDNDQESQDDSNKPK